jgi:hypothetical protein
VLKARDRRLNRLVKHLLSCAPEHEIRFRREVEITARLRIRRAYRLRRCWQLA